MMNSEIARMKKTQTLKYCEFCDKALLDVSPPTTEQYEQGMITIREGSVCLNELVSAKRGGHAAYFEGTYCNLGCLMSQILKLLKPNAELTLFRSDDGVDAMVSPSNRKGKQ